MPPMPGLVNQQAPGAQAQGGPKAGGAGGAGKRPQSAGGKQGGAPGGAKGGAKGGKPKFGSQALRQAEPQATGEAAKRCGKCFRVPDSCVCPPPVEKKKAAPKPKPAGDKPAAQQGAAKQQGGRPATAGAAAKGKPAAAKAPAKPALTPEEKAAIAEKEAAARKRLQEEKARKAAELKKQQEEREKARLEAIRLAEEAEAARLEALRPKRPNEEKIYIALDALYATGAEAEANAIVALIDEVGVEVIGTYEILEKLEVAAGNKKKPLMRQAVPVLWSAILAKFGNAAEPYLAKQANVILECLADRIPAANALAVKAVEETQKMLASNPPSALALQTALVKSLQSSKWQARVAALEWVKALSVSAPVQLGLMLQDLVPVLSDLFAYLNNDVRASAEAAVEAAMQVMENKDVQPFIPVLIKAMKEPTEVPETVFALGSLTFVQSVETATLGVLVPLLTRGLNDRRTDVRRCCAVIISNMSKLVDNPADAQPFLPVLLPLLATAAEETSDPECRNVCKKATEQLLRIKKAAELAPARPGPAELAAMLQKEINLEDVPHARDWSSSLLSSLLLVNVFDEEHWSRCSLPYLTAAAKLSEKDVSAAVNKVREEASKWAEVVDEEEENEDAELLCDCKFTLAYGTKILLHNTNLKLKRGYRYGLLGGNDSGKSTLMRAIANGQVEGFPPATELKTVFVEADIQGEMSHLACLDYVFEDERIRKCGASREEVQRVLLEVGFSEKMCGDAITTLSGGWRMKLALARAMLQHADILLLDEPTNHLDVLNVRWVEDYLVSLKDVTSIIVSHNAGLLDKCCTHMLFIEDLKLKLERGNLSSFVERHPKAQSFFELKSELKFKFPQPGYLEGVKSKGKTLMRMDGVSFTYPGNTKPTLTNVSVQVSLASRVACVGVNGAGKSTMIKLLTGELVPCEGTVWTYNSARIAYVAQHAFHHIEKHLDMTPNQYISWRYQNGEDKEALAKVTVQLTAEEEAKIKEPIVIEFPQADGVTVLKKKLVIDDIVDRRKQRQQVEYEVKFEGLGYDQNKWMKAEKLEALGFTKVLKQVDVRVEAREGMYKRPLTTANVEKHLGDVGLAAEFATHTRMSALSGGQKVKVVLAAAMWNQPHILILDEPTNYLDRESLGALANAIREYEGGVVMITHNDQFCSELCPETWVLEHGTLECKGDAEWMKNALETKAEFQMMTEMVDAAGNVTKVKPAKKTLSNKERKALERKRKNAAAMGMTLSEDEDEDW